MPNTWISLYEKQKNYTKDYLESALAALSGLQADREQLIKTKGIARHGMKFFNKSHVRSNIVVINQILLECDELRNKFNSTTLEKKDRDEILNILRRNKDNLKSGQTKELVEHIILDISKIDYSNRPSTIISPSSIEVVLEDKEYADNQSWQVQLSPLLKRKNLPLDIFDNTKDEAIQLEDNIALHVAWAFKHIYSFSYPFDTQENEKIARFYHGIQHVARAAYYIPVWANLYRKYGDKEALALTEEDIKLLQIAAIFHDSAREDENEDKWDHESAIFLYRYLTQVLDVGKSKAKLIAEAMANKDPNPKGYFVINENRHGIEWRYEPEPSSKNIYQKLIHDADCLDIIRLRENFDAQHLDFYKDYGAYQELALDEVTHLRLEAQSLIATEGDEYNNTDSAIKQHYENSEAYHAIKANAKNYRILSALGEHLVPQKELTKPLIETIKYDPAKGLTEENMRAGLREGKIFARGIGAPSALRLKRLRSGEYETFADTEIIKGKRIKGVATRTLKENRNEKEGNPDRSISMMGYGAPVYTSAGFLIVNPALEDIREISAVDINSGRAKKEALRTKVRENKDNAAKEKELKKVNQTLKLGGKSVKFTENPTKHPEIIYHVKENSYSGIYYTNDTTLYNIEIHEKKKMHPNSAILQAIYLRNQYMKRDSKHAELPIFEYSGVHNIMTRVPESELTKENIMKLWLTMCSDYMKNCLEDLSSKAQDFYTMSTDEIKIMSMYGMSKVHIHQIHELTPADANYDPEFITELNIVIIQEKERLIASYRNNLVKQVTDENLSVLSDKFFFYAIKDPLITQLATNNINQEFANVFNKSESCSIDEIHDYLQEISYVKNPSQAFYQNKVARIYRLAVLSNSSECIQRIQSDAKELVLDEIRNINSWHASLFSKNMNIHTSSNEFIHFITTIRYADFFNLFPTDTEMTHAINRVLSQFLTFFTANITQNPNVDSQMIHEFFSNMDDLHKNGFLSSEHIKTIGRIILWMEKNIFREDLFDGDNVSELILLTKNLQMDGQDNLLLSWLKSANNFSIQKNDWCKLLDILKDTKINDQIFHELINRIGINFYPKHNPKVDMHEWVTNLSAFKGFISLNEFSDEQSVIIATRANELFDIQIHELEQTLLRKSEIPYEHYVNFLWTVHGFLTTDIEINLSANIRDKIMEKLKYFSEHPIADNNTIKMFDFVKNSLSQSGKDEDLSDNISPKHGGAF